MTAQEILEQVRIEGGELWAEGGQVKGRIPAPLMDEVRLHKQDLLAILSKHDKSASKIFKDNTSQQTQPDTDTLTRLRLLGPHLWKVVRTNDGRNGVLWRVGPVDVAIWFDPMSPIHTLQPSEVNVPNRESEG